MSIILTPFAKLLLLFYDLTGSYGVSLILFGLVIRLILFPIFLKGRKGMLSMSGLAEKQKVLQQKYARDRVKYSQELQRLYEEEGVKPSSGCLWSFLPLPFLMVLYAIVRQPLTYLLNMTQDQFNVVSNLLYGNVLDYRNQQLQMAQDVFLNHDKIVAAVPELANMPQIDFTFLGVNLSQTPHFMFWKADDIGAAFGLWLIPVISAALGVVSMIVTKAVHMAQMMSIPVLGLIENYSYYQCPDCGAKHAIFGESHLEQEAMQLGLPLLAQLPIDPELAAAIDVGKAESLPVNYLEGVAEQLDV